jgi:hypothetical protein
MQLGKRLAYMLCVANCICMKAVRRKKMILVIGDPTNDIRHDNETTSLSRRKTILSSGECHVIDS